MNIIEIATAFGMATALALTDKVTVPEGTATALGLGGTYVIVKLVLHNEMTKLEQKFVSKDEFKMYVQQHADATQKQGGHTP